MGDTPSGGETATVQPLENKTSQPSGTSSSTTTFTITPSEIKTEDGEIEAARKRAEQAEMRANQLANQLKAKEDAEARAQAKELENQNKFKELYEQSQAKLEEIERQREADEQRQAVTETSQNILSDYSDEVKEAAKDLGLVLDEVADDKVAEFKGKLDKLQTRIGNQRVTPNNPGAPSGQKQYTGEELRQILADPVKRDAYYRAKNGVTAMMMNPQS